MTRTVSWKEIWYRLKAPRWVLSHAARQWEDMYHRLATGEFSEVYRRVRPYTMCSPARLKGLYQAVRDCAVDGDIVECGTARGGSAALMGLTAPSRRLWVFDTFEGLPAPSRNDPDFEIAALNTGTCVGTIDDVSTTFASLGVTNATLVKGLFQDTLPVTPIPKIAVLHIDGDWYDSVRVCLDALFDRVVPYGVIQFDDYGFWQGARSAVDRFFAERDIAPTFTKLDYSGRQYVKRAVHPNRIDSTPRVLRPTR